MEYLLDENFNEYWPKYDSFKEAIDDNLKPTEYDDFICGLTGEVKSSKKDCLSCDCDKCIELYGTREAKSKYYRWLWWRDYPHNYFTF